MPSIIKKRRQEYSQKDNRQTKCFENMDKSNRGIRCPKTPREMDITTTRKKDKTLTK